MTFMTAGALYLYSMHMRKSIQGVTWLCDNPPPDIKTRVVTGGRKAIDGRTDGQKSPK